MDKNNIKHTMMSDMIAYSIYIYRYDVLYFRSSSQRNAHAKLPTLHQSRHLQLPCQNPIRDHLHPGPDAEKMGWSNFVDGLPPTLTAIHLCISKLHYTIYNQRHN